MTASSCPAKPRPRRTLPAPPRASAESSPAGRAECAGRLMSKPSPAVQPVIPQMHAVDAVAQRLGVASKTVRRMIRRGELPVHCIGRLLRVSDDDLHEYLLKRRAVLSADLPK